MRDSIALLLLASLASLAWACNSTRADSCVTPGSSVLAAGASPSNCTGTCRDLTIPEAGTIGFCEIPCTDTSQCTPGKSCVSLAQLGVFDSGASFCIYECAKDDAGNDAGACPSQYTCFSEYGVCF